MAIAKNLTNFAHLCTMPARFYEQNISSKLTNKRKLSEFLDITVSMHLKKIRTIELTYVFCNDRYLHQINKDFLNHDTYTDIITFDFSENKNELRGEIYISVERVKENAAEYNVSYQEELHRVIFHGALHLCGFKDKAKADKKKMRTMEDKCLQAYRK